MHINTNIIYLISEYNYDTMCAMFHTCGILKKYLTFDLAYYCVNHNEYDVLKYLLNNVYLTNDDVEELLELSVMNKYMSTTKLLLKHLSKRGVISNTLLTDCLLRSIWNENNDMVYLLIQYGASPDSDILHACSITQNSYLFNYLISCY